MGLKIAEKEEALLLEDLQNEVIRDFHLNYEEHLRPFSYGTIDAIDKEIVESHVEVCAVCREDLRDLLNFHQDIEREKEIRALSKTSWWTQVADWFSATNRKMVWLVCASLIVFIGTGLVWFFVSRPVNELVQNTGNVQLNQTVPDEIQTRTEPDRTVAPTASNQSNTPNKRAETSEKEVELANLDLPKFLNDLELPKNETLRGNNDVPAQKIAVISPNGTVLRDSAPILTWKRVPEIENYEVAVFDADFNRLAKIDAFKGNSWRAPNLPKGKIYQWQVSAKTVSANGKTTNFLGRGKFYIVGQESENRINQARNLLEKGKALAEAGLLGEAAAEFRKYLRENPNSETAKKWLNQVLRKK